MPTLKEQIELLTSHKHRLAVWEAVFQYLDDSFVSKDGRSPQKAIKAEGCTVEIVPEDVVEEILSALSDGPIKELKEKIAEVETLEVVAPGRKTKGPRRQNGQQAPDQDS